MSRLSPNLPTKTERLVAGLCYPTIGIIGVLYVVFSKSRGDIRSYPQLFRFHLTQSMVLGVIAALIGWAAAPLLGIVDVVLRTIWPAAEVFFFKTMGVMTVILSFGFILLLVYGAVGAFLGKFAEVPVIAALVKRNMF
jgi:hypothetical protein